MHKFKIIKSVLNNNAIFRNPIYFMHVPKCGGTTIDQIFLKLSKVLGSFNFSRFSYNQEKNNKKFFIEGLTNDYPRYISGHLDFNFTKNLKNVFKCTIIRNPLDRTLSHYKFALFKLNKKPTEYSLVDYIKDETDNYRDNLVTRHFSGMLEIKKELIENDKQKALKNIKIFDQVDIFENWDYFVAELLSKHGLPSILYSRFQEHVYDFVFNPSESDIELIRQHYNYDFEIYNAVLKFISKKKKNYEKNYYEKICLVSPYLKDQNRLYEPNELKKYFKSKINL